MLILCNLVCRIWLQVNAGSLYFAFGGLSKLIATIVTYPLQLLQTRARVRCTIRVSDLCFDFD